MQMAEESSPKPRMETSAASGRRPPSAAARSRKAAAPSRSCRRGGPRGRALSRAAPPPTSPRERRSARKGRRYKPEDRARRRCRRRSASSRSVFCTIDLPRSPCSALPRNVAYCCHSGRSRPYSACIAAMVSGVARPMVMISMGSPGTRWIGEERDQRHPQQNGDHLHQAAGDELQHGRALARESNRGEQDARPCRYSATSYWSSRHILQPPPAGRQGLPALDVVVVGVDGRRVGQRHAVAVVVDDVLDLLEDLAALGRIGRGAGLGQQMRSPRHSCSARRSPGCRPPCGSVCSATSSSSSLMSLVM